MYTRSKLQLVNQNYFIKIKNYYSKVARLIVGYQPALVHSDLPAGLPCVVTSGAGSTLKSVSLSGPEIHKKRSAAGRLASVAGTQPMEIHWTIENFNPCGTMDIKLSQ